MGRVGGAGKTTQLEKELSKENDIRIYRITEYDLFCN